MSLSKYLHKDCTVKENTKGVEFKTFRDNFRVTIAKSNEHSSVTVGIKDSTKEVKIQDVPEKKWTEVECRVSSDEEIECNGEKFNTAENNFGKLSKEIVIRNAEVLTNCPQGLPNKLFHPLTSIKFPRSNSTEERFAVIPEVNQTVDLSIFGEDFVLCWDGNQTAVKTSEGDCQALPAHEAHKITLDYESHEIKSADGRVLRTLNGTNANEDDLILKMKTVKGNAWVVQSLGDWPHPQDQNQNRDNQSEGVCNFGGNSEVILAVFLVLSLIAFIALIINNLRLRCNLSRIPSGSPGLQMVELNAEGNTGDGEDSVIDVNGNANQ